MRTFSGRTAPDTFMLIVLARCTAPLPKPQPPRHSGASLLPVLVQSCLDQRSLRRPGEDECWSVLFRPCQMMENFGPHLLVYCFKMHEMWSLDWNRWNCSNQMSNSIFAAASPYAPLEELTALPQNLLLDLRGPLLIHSFILFFKERWHTQLNVTKIKSKQQRVKKKKRTQFTGIYNSQS